ncbi:hypothetical protein ZIOFF_015587 [Zingiber officinale]|uniref:Uncharacterized protein n=1 Tax=Zingiber officinale TaxID=94328 RepID=A0A8J5HF60_ZINOF|nr:hypothetical protein ZIOFF_015587 [Zingiber officinale]
MDSEEHCCVKVTFHIRPLIEDERLQGCKECVVVVPGKPQENNTAVSSQIITHGGQDASGLIQGHSQVTVERDLVSQAEEEDMEALLGTYVMGIGEAEAFSERLKRELLALEAANVHALVECESIIEEVLSWKLMLWGQDKAPYIAKATKLKTEYTKKLAMYNKNQRR